MLSSGGEHAAQGLMPSFDAMMKELGSDNPLFLPSDFWADLNEKNRRMLDAEGLSNFKRTVAQNYFNWIIPDADHVLVQHARNEWGRRPNLLPLLTRLKETDRLRFTTSDQRAELTAEQRDIYRQYVCHVWTIMRRLDRHGLRHKVGEPRVGNPLRVMFGLKLLSQDLATSIIECNVLADLTKGVRSPRIAEVGAGYGRVAHTYAASGLPGQYFVFDIPPALGVAQWYLERTLGPDRIFRFRPFDRFEEIEGELARCKVALFTANQICKFPDRYFDVALTISTLPEMRQEQVDFYLSEFQRLSRGHIFIKQWKAWKNQTDGTDLTSDSYAGSEVERRP